MSKGSSQTVTQNVDPATQQYVDYMRRVAMGYVGGPGMGSGAPSGADPNAVAALRAKGGAWADLADKMAREHPWSGGGPITQPLPPELQQAIGQYGQYAQGGLTGFGALTGNPAAQQQFMNPYLSAMNPFFAQQRAQAIQGANQQATLAGAFGGDRSQIGAATAGNLADQTQAGFNYQAFTDAMQRALQASMLGFGAIGQGAFLPQRYASGQLGLLQQALGPYGQTTTQQMPSDPFGQFLGTGLTLASLFGGPAAAGAAAGGGAGVGGGALLLA